MCLDLIRNQPQMNQVMIRELNLFRRLRTEFQKGNLMRLSLQELRFAEGTWSGMVGGIDPAAQKLPEFTVSLHGKDIAFVTPNVKKTPERVELSFVLPFEAIGNGAHTLLVIEKGSVDILAKISLISGDLAAEDLCSEISMLREKLDLLKRAFRRHCLET